MPAPGTARIPNGVGCAGFPRSLSPDSATCIVCTLRAGWAGSLTPSCAWSGLGGPMPTTITLVVVGRCRPSPDRVPEGASPDRDTCGIVSGHLSLAAGQWLAPVLVAPHRRVRGVHGDDRRVDVGEPAAPGQRPLVVGGLGERTGPPGRRLRGQALLAGGPRVVVVVQTVGTPGFEVQAGEASEEFADQAQHLVVHVGGVLEAVAYHHPGRAQRDERVLDLPVSSPQPSAAAASRALRARFLAERRPYRRAQNEVSTSTMSRTRSSSTLPSSRTTRRRPDADKAASTSSTFIRPSRSLCSTTTVVTFGSASSRFAWERQPFTPEAISDSIRTTR